MDTKTFILGVVPPMLAIIAELLNPISDTTVAEQSEKLAGRYAHQGNRTPIEFAQNVTELTEAITKTVVGVVEISALIPTWISATAGITAILVDQINPCWSSTIVAVWTALSALFGIKYFAGVRYYDTGAIPSKCRICRGLTNARCLSWGLVGVNGLVIMAVVGTAGWQYFHV